MNKKYLMIGLPILALGLVMAGVMAYYGMFSAEFTVVSAIEVSECSDIIGEDIFSGEEIIGSPCTITNNAPSERIIIISNNAPVGEIEVDYIGTLELTTKTVEFGVTPWVVLGNKVQIEYTVVGEDFNAEVTNGAISGYVLVYYTDNDNRFTNPGEVILVEDVSENLPGIDDENADLNDYSAEYTTTPFGAKIWYVPSNAIPGGVIDWTRADEFYFESSLIQYNANGLITVYPNETLDIKPVYKLGTINGTYTIETTIA